MDTDPQEIARGIAARLEQAWNAGDGEGFAAPFTEAADFVDLRGTHHHGRAEIAEGHVGIFGSIYRDSRITYVVTGARAIGTEVIVAHSTGHLAVPAGPLAGERDAVQTLVIAREDGAWKVTAFHNTLVAPPPGSR
jgi:uncharacterized protein (TIGR02246 family)